MSQIYYIKEFLTDVNVIKLFFYVANSAKI
jgi:hypothetical protein